MILFAMLLPSLALAEKSTTSLCEASEKILFNCTAGQKQVSVCASEKNEKIVQYRYGSPTKVELKIPTAGVQGVRTGSLMYSGGGGAYVTFKNEDSSYTVFSKITNSGESAGVTIFKKGKRIRQLLCLAVNKKTDVTDVNPEALKKLGVAEETADQPDL